MSTIVVVDPALKAPDDLLLFQGLEEGQRRFLVKLLEDTGSEFIEVGPAGASITSRLIARALEAPARVGYAPPEHSRPTRLRAPAKKQSGPGRHKGHSAGTPKRKRCPKCGELVNKRGFTIHMQAHKDPQAFRLRGLKARLSGEQKRPVRDPASIERMQADIARLEASRSGPTT